MPKSIRSDGLRALGRAVAEIRRERSLTQREFAASIGSSKTFIARIELGTRRIDVVELVVLARLIGVDPTDLLERVADATPSDQEL